MVDGSNQYNGRVEVYTSCNGSENAQWGVICANYYWNIQNARVVCRQLGYPDAVGAPRDGRYGSGFRPILLDDVQCQGDELDILTCHHCGIGTYYCPSYQFASAECLGV